MVSTAQQERAEALQLPDDDVVGVLLIQHARIRDLFQAALHGFAPHDEHRKQVAYHELRTLLAVHETAEEMIVRPALKQLAGEEEVQARNDEEAEATKALAELEKCEFGSSRFHTLLAGLERSVSDHAEREEQQEFTLLRTRCTEADRIRMGKRLLAAENAAPTRPHPATAGSTTAQWALAPFTALLDRACDAIRSSPEH